MVTDWIWQGLQTTNQLHLGSFTIYRKIRKENHNDYGEKEYESVIREMKKEMMRLREEVKDTDEGEIRMMEILRKKDWKISLYNWYIGC